MKTDDAKIAKFMGWEKYSGNSYKCPNTYPIENNVSNGWTTFTADQLEFSSRWDWLMPVVEKIESLGFATKFRHEIFKDVSGYQDIEIFSLNENNGYKRVACCTDRIPKIEAIYKAVVQFIDWYNENKK
jgi:hypothetical protein